MKYALCNMLLGRRYCIQKLIVLSDFGKNEFLHAKLIVIKIIEKEQIFLIRSVQVDFIFNVEREQNKLFI